MTQPTHRTIESILAAHLQTIEATRAVAAQALTAAAWALYAAAGSVVVLMFVVYAGSAMRTGTAVWPGKYWFTVVPLVVAAVTLHLGAVRIGRPRRG